MKNKIIKTLVGLQFILFPFLDMLRTTNFRKVEFLGISLIELINIVIIGSALLLTLIKMFKNKKRYILMLGLYLILCFAYCVYAKQYKDIVMLLPILGLWVTTIAAPMVDIRYIYPMFLTIPLYIGIIAKNSKIMSEKK